MYQCQIKTSQRELYFLVCHLSSETSFDVVEMIKDLLRNHSSLIYDELVTVLNKLKDIINVSVVTPDLGQALINLISDIVASDSDLEPFTNTYVGLDNKAEVPVTVQLLISVDTIKYVRKTASITIFTVTKNLMSFKISDMSYLFH